VLPTLGTKQLKPELSTPLTKILFVICILVSIALGYQKYIEHTLEQEQALTYIDNPKVGDIYFLDMRLLQDKLTLKNKYKLAKVVRVGDEGLSIVYGSFFYQWQYSVVQSIQYGDLRNIDYFTSNPEYFAFNDIKKMSSQGAIYLVKRPMGNKIYGNYASPD